MWKCKGTRRATTILKNKNKVKGLLLPVLKDNLKLLIERCSATNKQNVIYPYNGMLFTNTNEWTTDPRYDMNDLKSSW